AGYIVFARGTDLCGDCQRVHRGQPMDDFVALEVPNERITRLHRVKGTVGFRSLEERPQFHKMMAATAGIEAVKRDDVFLVAIQRLPVDESHRDDPAAAAAT